MIGWRGWLLMGGVLAAGGSFLPPDEPQVLILMGDSDGYLAPCGCTKPMTGGIQRRATAVRVLTEGKPATILENGGLIAGTGRQDHLKAEALAESLRHMKVSAIALTGAEARLGSGLIQSLRNLAGERFVQSNLLESPTNEIPRFFESGPFLVGAVGRGHERLAAALNESFTGNLEAAKALAEQAHSTGKAPVLLLSDGLEEAEHLAREVPELRLIQYRSAAKPGPEPGRIGKTWLVSPGEKGKHVLRLVFDSGEFKGYRPVELGPDFRDDPAVSRTYLRYLKQVEREDLLAKLPRSPSLKFAGNAKCGSCHAKATKVWLRSEHAHALRTLIAESHGRDPDCVACHVVGLAKITGFQSVRQTPQLAHVGCESCHGPGAAHAAKPKVRMGRVGSRSCSPCHVPEHSPGFNFAEYWKRIAH